MKIFLLFIVLTITPLCNFAQEETVTSAGESSEPEEKKAPFDYEGSIFGDMVRNFKGGISQHFAYLGIMDIGISFSTGNAGFWEGGELFFQVENTHGSTPTADYVGDFQTFSNAEAGNNTCLYQLWYKQDIGRFFFLLGQHDLNSDFLTSDCGGTFINSSFGIMPSVSSNVPVSIFPVNTLAVMIGWKGDKFGFKTAVYDGDPGDFETNPYSLRWKLSKDEGLFAVAEASYSLLEDDEPYAVYKIGGYHHTGEFTDLIHDTLSHSGNSGAYFIADHFLMSENGNKEQGLGAFVMLGYAPGHQNYTDLFLGGGLHYHGLFPGRDKDDIGLAFGHASFNNYLVDTFNGTITGHETVVELTYKLLLGEHFEVQPDLQYIINTGGDPALGDSFVGLIRCYIGF